MQAQLLLLSTQSEWPCENDAPEPISQVRAQAAQLKPLLVSTFCFSWMLEPSTIEQSLHLQPPRRLHQQLPTQQCCSVR